MASVGSIELQRTRSDCRLCHSTTLDKVVPLQPIPVRTPNMGRAALDAASLDSAWVPLDLYRCCGCGHLQLLDMVDPAVQYTNFRYRTSISLGLPEHFKRMVAELVERLALTHDARVLELGSNDGTLLRCFAALGMEVMGIDPAEEIAAQACATGVPTLAEFFNSHSARELRQEHGAFDLVVANNTLANLDDLDDVLSGVHDVLTEDGVFVVETADGAAVIRDNLVDTVYHEHLNYFLVDSMAQWFGRQGFELFHVERVATKGGSLRAFAQKSHGLRELDASVAKAIAEEAQQGLDQAASFERLVADLENSRAALAEQIQIQRRAGARVAAFGASVGTVTLLHQFGLAQELDYIVDDNPLAESLDGPGYSIPIVPAARLLEDSPGLVVLLAHRYREVILERQSAYLEAGGQFAILLPSFELVGAGA